MILCVSFKLGILYWRSATLLHSKDETKLEWFPASASTQKAG